MDIDIAKATRESEDYLMAAIARSEASIIDQQDKIGDANAAYREILRGVTTLNGAGLVGAITLLTVSGFPTNAVGWAATLYLTGLSFSLTASALEIGRPFLLLYLARVSLTYSHAALDAMTKPVGMGRAAALEDTRHRAFRQMLLGWPWGWAVRFAPSLTAFAAVGFLCASIVLLVTGWSYAELQAGVGLR